MDCLLHVGNKMTKEFREHLGKLICDILKSGFDNHSPSDVIIKALDVCQKATAVENVNVINSVFNSAPDKKK